MTLTDEEIRVKVAELMGCKRYKRPYDGKVFLCLDDPGGRDSKWKVVDVAIDRINTDVPWYPTDPASALQLCDRMHSEGCIVTMILGGSGQWCCEVVAPEIGLVAHEWGTFPGSISRTFLKYKDLQR